MASVLRDHYRTLVEDRGFDRPRAGTGDLPAAEVERRFTVADRWRAFTSHVDAGEPAIVTTGISMTGPPHAGTLGQLRTAIRLQEAGLDVQLVVADLPAYLAAGRDLDEVRALAARYRSFAVDLGFDARDGVLRTQLDAPGVLRTAMRLSRYYDPDAEEGEEEPDAGPTAFERELAVAYESADTPGTETPAFAGTQTGLLLVADTLNPIVEGGYDHVCFVGGADNHGLASAVRTVLDASPYVGTVAGLYTRLVPGLAGVPKMSKSLPRSTLSLADGPGAVREWVSTADEGLGDLAVVEMLRLASPLSAAELDGVVAARSEGGDDWVDARRRFASFLADAAETWRRTSGSATQG